ncbi:hypothetical protein OCH7691_03578 [Oceanibacterium hippocampi]|uniref:UPF0276 protein OCH7691_03578 n=2 Tax=Oceanibacterium hippocampi TaxID=745714 RepID=A0A1Y5U089_9PROT|nr:hypothetical protein OCH7691_03578 [Oceanibacterium hippocampi]
MPVPSRAGVGLKADHVDAILDTRPDVGWFEVHAENYMGAGGPPHRWLTAICRVYPLSVHGVGLSIGSAGSLDKAHLARLRALVRRYEPGLVSEHLAWSSHAGIHYNDLLPLPYSAETLDRVADHVDLLQETLARPVLIENPATYVAFEASDMSELDFLRALVARTGCGLLLDVNNVLVSATNGAFSAEDYLDSFPLEAVGELHLAGHARERDGRGAEILIDAHDRAVPDTVWTLYERTLGRSGPLPTLIEWDNDLPDWTTLLAEAGAAERRLRAAHGLSGAAAPSGRQSHARAR